MSEIHMVQGERTRRGMSRLMAGSAVAMMAVAAYALPVWIQGGGEAQAQGGAGAGTAAATIAGATNVPGVPGGTAAVSFGVVTGEGESAAVGFDVVFDSSLANLSEGDCQLDERLEDQIRSVTFPPSEQPDPPNRRIRLGVFPPIANPVPSFDDGTVFVCNFGVANGVGIGTVIDLVVEPLQVARADNSVICEGEACAAVDGSILVSQPQPPTATRTPSVGATATRTPTVTPTMDGNMTPTNTPTTVVEDTATPTPTTPVGEASPTNTVVPTRTNTVGPTPTNTVVLPTATSVPPTAVPRTPDFDDSCAIVPTAQDSSNHSLILLLVPALLLWARRRES